MPSIRNPRNWRVRSRLVLLITIPTAAAVALGVTSSVSSWQTALTYQRVQRLAALCEQTTGLANALETERDETVDYLALTRAGTSSSQREAALVQRVAVLQQVKITAPWIKGVDTGLAGLGSGYSATILAGAQSLRGVLATLPSLRAAAGNSSQPALDVISGYGNVISGVLAFDNQIALTTSDPQLAPTLKALDALSGIEQEYSTQRAIVVYALERDKFAPGMLPALNASIANLAADRAVFASFATPAQQQDYHAKTSAALLSYVTTDETAVLAHATSLSDVGVVSAAWHGEVNNVISAVRSVERDLVAQAVARASTLRHSAINSAMLIGGAVLFVLAASLVLTVLIGRSMVRLLPRPHGGALARLA